MQFSNQTRTVIAEFKYRIVHPGHGSNHAEAEAAALLRATLVHTVEMLYYLVVFFSGYARPVI